MLGQVWEERVGLVDLFPMSPLGLLMSCGFWLVVDGVCRVASRVLAGRAYANLAPADRDLWNNYACSAMHGVIGFVGAVRGVSPYFPGSPPDHYVCTPVMKLYMQLTLAFFVMDTVKLLMNWSKKPDFVMLAHHIALPTAYGTCLYIMPRHFGCYVMMYFQLCEITTPFLHIRWFLSFLGHKASVWYLVNGLVLSILFVLVRGVLMTTMVVREYSSLPSQLYVEDCTLCTVIMWTGYVFQLVQYVWCVKMVRGALAFLKTKPAKAGKAA